MAVYPHLCWEFGGLRGNFKCCTWEWPNTKPKRPLSWSHDGCTCQEASIHLPYMLILKILVSFSKKKRKIQRLQVNQIMVCTHWRQIILIDMWKWDCILWNSMPHGKWKNIIFMVLTWCSRIFLLIFMLAHRIPMLKVKGSSPKLD